MRYGPIMRIDKMFYPRALFALILCFAFLGSEVFRADAGETKPRMCDFIDLNGHTVAFKPELYRRVCGLVRDYHPVEWDLGGNSAELPEFPFAKNGVDWSRVYASWRTNGWNTDVCLQFESLKQSDWVNIVTNEPGRLRVQEYRNDTKKIIWAIWSPTGNGKVFSLTLEPLPGRLVDAQHMPLTANPASLAAPPQVGVGLVEVQVDESPLYLFFENPQVKKRVQRSLQVADCGRQREG
jgi:hypothetical protein